VGAGWAEAGEAGRGGSLRAAGSGSGQPGAGRCGILGAIGLDPDACFRALRARDRRFDGRFYTGVRSTGVFCRPVCPARPPRREHCRFFASAAGAREAGFRPCLRCRPEAAPGTPAWSGTSATVDRALRLIGEQGLGPGGCAGLAARLGVGDRHLRRLFQRHLGTTPARVDATRRLLFAKTLLGETSLGMGEVASAAGYGSVRRFNAAVRDAYGRPPGALRRTAGGRGRDAGVRIRLAYRPPYAWESLLGFLAERAIPGVEAAVDGAYWRTLRLAGRRGALGLRPVPGEAALELELHGVPVAELRRVVERVRALADLDADPQRVAGTLLLDPVLAPAVARRPGLRVPGAFDPFELAVRAVVGQQVAVGRAGELAGRLAGRRGDPLPGELVRRLPGALRSVFPAPASLRDVDARELGVPEARARALRALAAAVEDDPAFLSAWTPLEDLLQRLTTLPGVGPWTAAMIAMRGLGQTDAFPEGDLGLRKAFGRVVPVAGRALAEASRAWRPWRAYAALHLWASLASDGGPSREIAA